MALKVSYDYEEREKAWKKMMSKMDDDNFLPKGASKEHADVIRKLFEDYFLQIDESEGFDIDIYPGDCELALFIPYLEFEKEADMLMELADHAIQGYNNRETNVYKYKVACIEKVNYLLAAYREFFMTVVAKNLTVPGTSETFQIQAYKGPREENVVLLCRKKSQKYEALNATPKLDGEGSVKKGKAIEPSSIVF